MSELIEAFVVGGRMHGVITIDKDIICLRSQIGAMDFEGNYPYEEMKRLRLADGSCFFVSQLATEKDHFDFLDYLFPFFKEEQKSFLATMIDTGEQKAIWDIDTRIGI